MLRGIAGNSFSDAEPALSGVSLLTYAFKEATDYAQRLWLRRGMPPLLRRIMQIHLTEEARHLCFADSVVVQKLKTVSRPRRLRLRVLAPLAMVALGYYALDVLPAVLALDGGTAATVRETNSRPAAHRRRWDVTAKTVALCRKLGILTPRLEPLWRLVGALPPEGPAW